MLIGMTQLELGSVPHRILLMHNKTSVQTLRRTLLCKGSFYIVSAAVVVGSGQARNCSNKEQC